MCVRAFGLGKEQFKIVIGAHGVAKQKSLHIRATELLKEAQLILIFDTFCYYIHVQIAAHLNNRIDNRGVIGVSRNIPDKGPVDFKCADRELLKRTKGGIAGAEIIDCQMQSQAVKLVE